MCNVPRWLFVVGLAAFLIACDGEDPTDAGADSGAADSGAADSGAADSGSLDAGVTDAGADGGFDGGLDAGGPDAGWDAGPPTPDVLAPAVVMERAALDTAIDGVAVEMRTDGAFANLSLAASGVDALIGEDGLMTLVLADPAVRALADLHQANLVLILLDDAILGLTARAEAAAVLAQTTALRASFSEYRDALARLYVERVADGIIGAPVIEELFYTNLDMQVTPAESRLVAVVEGDVGGTASVGMECIGGDTILINGLEILNLETRASLGTGIGENNATVTLPALPVDTATAIEIRIDATVPPMGYDSCTVTVTSRRRLRAAPVAIGAGNTAFFDARSIFSGAVAGHDSEVLTLSGSADPELLLVAARALTLIADLVAPYLPSDTLPIPLETYQRVERRVRYVRAMIDALMAGDEFSDIAFEALQMHTATAMDAAEAMVDAL